MCALSPTRSFIIKNNTPKSTFCQIKHVLLFPMKEGNFKHYDIISFSALSSMINEKQGHNVAKASL